MNNRGDAYIIATVVMAIGMIIGNVLLIGYMREGETKMVNGKITKMIYLVEKMIIEIDNQSYTVYYKESHYGITEGIVVHIELFKHYLSEYWEIKDIVIIEEGEKN